MGWFRKIFEEVNLRFLSYSQNSNHQQQSNERHIESALYWFRNSAVENCYASKYSMLWEKYFPPLPESVAGWISTLIKIKKEHPQLFTRIFGDKNPYKEIGDWLLSVQRPDGTFASSYEDPLNQPPAIFTNGCVISGLISLYIETKDEKIIEAAKKSAEWLLQMQMNDGSWKHYTYNVAYSNTMTAYSLICLGKLLNENRYIEAGKKKIYFVLNKQKNNGSFFEDLEKSEYHHTDIIAYTLYGMLLSSEELNDHVLTDAVAKGFLAHFVLLRNDGYLPGEINDEYKTTVNYCCITGNSLMSKTGMLLYKKTNNEIFKTASVKLLQYVKDKQLHSRYPYLEGGIPASWPISGKYLPYEINSTGERLFIDALLDQI